MDVPDIPLPATNKPMDVPLSITKIGLIYVLHERPRRLFLIDIIRIIF